jgi:Copper type II ascorbate-dependent monooxygenase, C-terminal domain/Copper type II ascorbate-dependent monooxygenase, N-terminal domain
MKKLWLLTLMVAGCGSSSSPQVSVDGGAGGGTAVSGPIVYYKDIQPLVQKSCVGCHQQGGVAPFALETAAQVQQMAGAISASVQSGRMPPFYAAPGCNEYADDPRWTEQEKASFEKWMVDGKPLGNESESQTGKPKASAPIREDVTMSMSQPFDIRKMGETDNYQCFVLDPKNSEDMLVTGFEVKPDNKQSVHHVLAYAVGEAQVAELLAKDATTPEVGYPCKAGGVGVQGAITNQVGSWVPGVGAVHLPPGSGLKLGKNGRIIMQVHYNLAAVAAGASPYDQTRIIFETSTSAGLATARIFPALYQKLAIAPNDANSVQSKELPALYTSMFFGDATVYAINGHMHLLGKSVRLDVLREDGTSKCLLHIPAYDFNWQQSYVLKQPFDLKKTDRFKITCSYDNSEANQPVIGGVKQMPRAVTWGEDTTDEMCMAYMTYVLKQ